MFVFRVWSPLSASTWQQSGNFSRRYGAVSCQYRSSAHRGGVRRRLDGWLHYLLHADPSRWGSGNFAFAWWLLLVGYTRRRCVIAWISVFEIKIEEWFHKPIQKRFHSSIRRLESFLLQRIIRQHTLSCVIIFLYLKRGREGRCLQRSMVRRPSG